MAEREGWRFVLPRLLERRAARLQGKGYGSTSITQEVKLLLQLLGRSPQLALDIGGNVGHYTAELRRHAPQLEVHVFEPSATNIAKLRARFAGDAQVTVVPAAVAAQAGAATLFADEAGSGLGSLSQRRVEHHHIEFGVSEAVTTIRFEDYWVNQLARRRLDIAKLDIEGHELAALAGFGAAMRATQVVQFEFGGCNIDTRTYFQDFWYFFRDQGFQLYRVTPLGLQAMVRYREMDEYFKTTNFLAANLHPA